MSPARYARWLAAFGGILLWLAIPYVVWTGGIAKHAVLCRGRVFTGFSDDCFNDYLPLFELVLVPLLIFAMTYPFARFAFSLYGPSPRPAGLAWSLASSGGSSDGWPYLQLFACIWCAWAVWRALLYAQASELMPFLLYWGAFALWSAAGALVGVADQRAETRSNAA